MDNWQGMYIDCKVRFRSETAYQAFKNETQKIEIMRQIRNERIP
jgi:hypothetical protein